MTTTWTVVSRSLAPCAGSTDTRPTFQVTCARSSSARPSAAGRRARQSGSRPCCPPPAQLPPGDGLGQRRDRPATRSTWRGSAPGGGARGPPTRCWPCAARYRGKRSGRARVVARIGCGQAIRRSSVALRALRVGLRRGSCGEPRRPDAGGVRLHRAGSMGAARPGPIPPRHHPLADRLPGRACSGPRRGIGSRDARAARPVRRSACGTAPETVPRS